MCICGGDYSGLVSWIPRNSWPRRGFIIPIYRLFTPCGLFIVWDLEEGLAHPAAWPDLSDCTSSMWIMEMGPLFPCVRTLSAGTGIITVRNTRSSVFYCSVLALLGRRLLAQKIIS